MPPKKQKRTAYPLDYKLRIVEEANLCDNNREIGRKHGIEETCVRNWRRDEMKIRDALSKGKMYHAGNAGRPPSGNAGRPPKPKDFTIHKWDWK